MAKRYSRVDSNVLIVGETGTGKSFCPQHPPGEQAQRRTLCGVKLCGPAGKPSGERAFGYEPGAFSGASKTARRACLNWPIRGPFSWMKSGRFPYRSRQSFSGYFRSGKSAASAATGYNRWMCALFLLPILILKKNPGRAVPRRPVLPS